MNQLIAFVQISRLLDGLFKHNDHTLLLHAKYIGWLLQEIWVTLLLPWQYEPQNGASGVSIGVALISFALVVSAAGSGSPFEGIEEVYGLSAGAFCATYAVISAMEPDITLCLG